MSEQTFLTNHFLIAMPRMDDPVFAKAVVYVCEHNENGAVAIIINHPLNLFLTDVLDNMEIVNRNPKAGEQPILFGGPLHQERGFVIHRPGGHWRSSFMSGDDIAITTSKDKLQAIAAGEGPKELIISLGCAGWGAGQLEQEIASNIWLNTVADPKIIFETPFEERWEKAASLLGIDIKILSSDTGHA